MTQSRRTFLAALGAGVGAALGATALGTAIRPRAGNAGQTANAGQAGIAGGPGPLGLLDRIGVQLYTVRGEMRRDVEETIERVAGIGFREVEFAGYFDRTPAQIAALLRRTGLTSPSTHIGYDRMRDDWARALNEAVEVGHAYATIPWIDAADRRTVDDWKRVAALFNERAAEARTAGLRFAYHNHDFEFARIDGIVPFDILLDGTDPDLVDFQLDIYWVTRGGLDAIDYFTRYPGRFTMTHLKDSAGAPEHRMVDVGSGTIDFPSVVAAAERAGVRHHFVEHDDPADPMASIRASYTYLAGIE